MRGAAVQAQQLQVGQALFHFFMNGAHSRGNHAWGEKIATTLQVHAVERGRH
jgi:hypothetical protein